MTALTWRNVDNPDFTGTISGVNNATKMLSDSLMSANAGIDKFRDLQASAADRAINARAMAYQDPAAYRQALADGSIVGDMAQYASPEALKALDSRAGTLLDQATKQQTFDKTGYEFGRVKEADALMQQYAPQVNQAKALFADGKENEGNALLASLGLRPDLLQELFKDGSQMATQDLSRDTSRQSLLSDQYDYGQKVLTDSEKRQAESLYAQWLPQAGTSGNVERMLYNAMHPENPKDAINPRIAMMTARMFAQNGFPVYQNLEAGGTGGAAPSGGGMPSVPVSGGAFRNTIPYDETRNYVSKITAQAGEVTGTNREKADKLLPFLINQESGGDPNAVSSKGARGLTQVMPKTGENPGYGVKPMQNQSLEEQKRFATDYLTAMLDKYNGDVDKALAAYNAGPRKVDGWVATVADGQTVAQLGAERDAQNYAQNPIAYKFPELLQSRGSDREVIADAIAKKLLPDNVDQANIRARIQEVQDESKGPDGKLPPVSSGVALAIILESSEKKTIFGKGGQLVADIFRTGSSSLGDGSNVNRDKITSLLEQYRTGAISDQMIANRDLASANATNTAATQALSDAKAYYQKVAANAQNNQALAVPGGALDQARAQMERAQARLTATVTTMGNNKQANPIRETTDAGAVVPVSPVQRVSEPAPKILAKERQQNAESDWQAMQLKKEAKAAAREQQQREKANQRKTDEAAIKAERRAAIEEARRRAELINARLQGR